MVKLDFHRARPSFVQNARRVRYTDSVGGIFLCRHGTECLDDLLSKSEFVSDDCHGCAKKALGRATFDVNWDQVYKEFGNPNNAFLFYEYATDRGHSSDSYKACYASSTSVLSVVLFVVTRQCVVTGGVY